MQASISRWPLLIFNCQCLLVPLLHNWTRTSFLGILTLFNLPPPPPAVSQLLNAHTPKDQSLPIAQSINVCVSLGLKGMRQSSRTLPLSANPPFFWKLQLKGRCENSAIQSVSNAKARYLSIRPRDNRTRDSEEKHDRFRTLWRNGPTEWEAT